MRRLLENPVRFFFFTGKGGMGKTSLACATAVALADRGELHEVQATLGHTNIELTSTCLNATTQGVKQAFKKLEAKRRRQGLKVVGR
jgi:MinD superfamily P-loop ATPase